MEIHVSRFTDESANSPLRSLPARYTILGQKIFRVAPLNTARQPAAAIGLIRYSARNPDARHMVLTGEKTGSGECLFRLSGNTETPSLYTETAYNPDTCQSFIDAAQAGSALSAPAGTSATQQDSSATGTGQGDASTGS